MIYSNIIKGILSVSLLIVSVTFLLFGVVNCRTLTPLEKCLNISQSKGLLKSEVKDTAYVSKCDRYHREQTMDKYNKTRYVILSVYDPIQKKYIKKKDEKGKYIYVEESPYSTRQILNFIETGQVPK